MEKFKHVPYVVEAMKVSVDNLTEIAKWLGTDLVAIHNRVSFTLNGETIMVPSSVLESNPDGALTVVSSYRDPTDSSLIYYNVTFAGQWIVKEVDGSYQSFDQARFNMYYQTDDAVVVDPPTEIKSEEPVVEEVLEKVVEDETTDTEILGVVTDDLTDMDVNELFGMLPGSDIGNITAGDIAEAGYR